MIYVACPACPAEDAGEFSFRALGPEYDTSAGAYAELEEEWCSPEGCVPRHNFNTDLTQEQQDAVLKIADKRAAEWEPNYP